VLKITQILSFLGVTPKKRNWTPQEARNNNFDLDRLRTHDLPIEASFL